MRFKPSIYSDAAALTPPATGASGSTGSGSGTSSLVSSAIQAGAALVSTGADIYMSERDRAEAEQARRARAARKKKKKKSAVAAPTAVALAPTALAPTVDAALPTWAKWGLGVAGVAALGFVAWKFLGAKEEPASAPQRRRVMLVKRNPVPKLKPVKPAPASSASMFRDEKTERSIDEAVEAAHGEAYDEGDESSDFDLGGEEE